MVKIYFALFLLITAFNIKVSAQTPPAATYASPQTYTVGVAITPLSSNNTGGYINLFRGYSGTSQVAGNGQYGNANGTSDNASFANPLGITNDQSGNIFVADANNNQIRKIAPDGTVSVLAGSGARGSANGTGTAATFNYPTGIVADISGNVYVADYNNNMIRKITPAGVVTTLAGATTSGAANGNGIAASFYLPYSLTLDVAGNIIVADTYNHLIRKITPAGTVTTLAGSGAIGSQDGSGVGASFFAPYGVFGDNAGNVYVADTYNNLIRKITAVGAVTTVHLTAGYVYRPIGITMDNLNNLYITGQLNCISQISPTGKNNTFFSGNFNGGSYDGRDTSATYGGNMGIAYDGSGHLLVADANNFLIRAVSLTGYQLLSSYQTLTGAISGPTDPNKKNALTTFQLGPNLPTGLKLDSLGILRGTPTAASPATNYFIQAINEYGSNTATLNITVNGSAQTINFNAITAKTYGNAPFKPGATSTNTTLPIIYTSADTTIASIVGDTVIRIKKAGAVVITASQPGNANYNAATPVNQTLTINPAALTVTANNQSKIPGAVNPPLTIKYTGFVNGDDSTALTTLPVAQTTATQSSSAGTYSITVSGGAANNYILNYVSGTLTISFTNAISANGPTTFFTGGSVILSVTPVTGNTYQWYKDGNAITSATSPTYTATLSGSYTVGITSGGVTTISGAVVVTVQFHLPANNFQVEMISASCKGSTNGAIKISAVQPLSYTAIVTFNGVSTSYSFTDTTTVPNLGAGTYSVCIGVSGQTYSQCYSVNITEPRDLSVYTLVNKTLNSVSLSLEGGATYNISVNNVQYSTSQNNITLPLAAGNNTLQISTDKLCQGVVQKIIIVSDKIIPYPEPFDNILNVNVGNNTVGKVLVNIYSVIDGRLVYNNQYTNQSGVVQLDLSRLSSGMYFFKIAIDNTESVFKILKK